MSPMIHSRSDRPRGAHARVLDADALLTEARAVFHAQHPGDDPAKLRNGTLPQMLFTSDAGVTVVSGEGAGDSIHDDGTVTVLFTHTYDVVPVRLPVAALTRACSSETIDLADGVRTFGDRLETNFRFWFDRYRGLA